MAKTLGIGDTGPEVLNWQRYLVSQGFKITPDSKFGPSTLAATRAMQRKLGVKADGKVGHRTIDRQSATQSTPLPQARPDMPPAPQPQAPVLSGDMTGTPAPDPFVSSGPEADLASMHAGASNNRAQDAMAQELMGQYYDARKADAITQGAAPAYHAPPIDPRMQPVPPATFDVAAPPGSSEPSMDFSGTGEPLSPMGAPAPTDPRTRDMIIRMLLQNAGG